MAMAGGRAERETATGGQGYRPNRKGKLKRERRAGKSDGNWQQGARARPRGKVAGAGPARQGLPLAVATGTCVHAARGPRESGGRRGEDREDRRGWGCFPACLVAVGGVAMVASGGVGGSADLII